MIGMREVVYGLYGAYRLCLFDPQGLAYFNTTHEGFWRSFFSAILVAPIQFIITLVGLQAIPVRAGPARTIAIEVMAYVILVFAYPFAMYYISQLLDRQRQYVTYIVSYNWAGVLLAVLALPGAALGGGLLPNAVVDIVELGITVLSLAILWYIAKTALRVPGLTAAALVAIDVVLGIAIRGIVEARLAVA